MTTGFRSLLIGLVMAAIPLAASSADKKSPNLTAMTKGFTYYNKPGADMATHNRTVLDCVSLATRISHYGAPGDGGIAVNWAVDTATRAAMAGALEGCMVVRGWRVVKLGDSAGGQLASLGPSAIADRLAGEVGAETPWGEVVRVWGNEALRYSTRKTGSLPLFEKGLLSYQAATGQRAFEPEPGQRERPGPLREWSQKPALTPADLAGVPPGSAVVIIGISGPNKFSDPVWTYSFRRSGPRHDMYPLFIDGQPDFFGFYNTEARGESPGPRFEMRIIPPGRWRLASLDSVTRSLNFCLGSPSFEIAAGEVVYLGAYHSSSEDLTPSMAMDPVRGYLAGTPQAAIVRPAEYVNGSIGPCHGHTIYALEFSGVATDTGYRERLREP